MKLNPFKLTKTFTGSRYTIKAFVTSVNEPTTELCVWSLKRQGFEVDVLRDKNSLASKLTDIYNKANEDFLRVDADVVVNKNCNPQNIQEILRLDYLQYAWWVQFLTFDWFKQDVAHGGVQFIKAEAIPHLRKHVDEAMDKERPETYLSRLEVFHNPRRFETHPIVMGLHNYHNDVDRVKATKVRRNQLDNYDFELAEKINEL